MTNLHRENHYQINSVKHDIISKESRGKDATFERNLLKSWGEYKGWEYAKESLDSCRKPLHKPLNAK